MQRERRARGRAAMVVAVLILLSGGCEDLPSGFDFDRAQPEGLMVKEGDGTLVRVDEKGNRTGSLSVRVGERSGALELTFLNEKGATIVPAPNDYLEATISFPDMATFEQGVPGAFTGRLRGLKEGQTTIIFKYKRGTLGGGETRWVSPAIPLAIAP